MPLQLAVADGGNTGVDLRRHRGAHNLLGTGQKMVNVAVDSTIASRLTYMDFSVETRQRFTDIAEAMLSLNAGTARKATEAL